MEYIKKYDIPIIFSSDAHQPEHVGMKIEEAVEYVKKYGINEKVVYPHSFRHRYAKNFLEKFNDISLLADLMGHESIETTRIYLRRTASEQRELVDSIVTW